MEVLCHGIRLCTVRSLRVAATVLRNRVSMVTRSVLKVMLAVPMARGRVAVPLRVETRILCVAVTSLVNAANAKMPAQTT